MTGSVVKGGMFSIPQTLSPQAAVSTRPLMKEVGMMAINLPACAGAVFFSASGIWPMILRLAVVSALEEVCIRQIVAELTVVCGYARLLDDDRAQKYHQLGFLRFVIAVHEQASHSGNRRQTGNGIGEIVHFILH